MYSARNLLALLVFTALGSSSHAFAPTGGRMVSHRLMTENTFSVAGAKKSNLVRFATDVSTKEVDAPEPSQTGFLQKVRPNRNFNYHFLYIDI